MFMILYAAEQIPFNTEQILHHAQCIEDQLELNAQFLIAVHTGNLDDMQSALRRGADVNAIDNSNMLPLTFLATHGQPTVVQFLLDDASNFDAIIVNWTALMTAVMGQFDYIVQPLLEAGINPDVALLNGLTASQIALQERDREIANMIDAYSAERSSGAAFKKDINRVAVLTKILQRPSHQNNWLPDVLMGIVLDFLKPRHRSLQFLIGAEYVTSIEMRGWQMMDDAERQRVYQRLNPFFAIDTPHK